MKIRALAVAAVAIVLPLSAVACSADSTGDLDKGDLKKELVKSGLTDKQADCAAEAMIDADFTKDELDKINAGNQADVDEKKVKEFTDAITKCVVG